MPGGKHERDDANPAIEFANGSIDGLDGLAGDPLEQPAALAMTVSAPCDSLLFIGRTNAVKVKVWNRGTTPLTGIAHINLAGDWKQRMESQLEWWGGIVNLVATNKGPVERPVSPIKYMKDASWIEGIGSKAVTIPPDSVVTVTLNVTVPNEAAPVTYPARVSFGDDTVEIALSVRPPVSARMMLPSGCSQGWRPSSPGRWR